DSKFGALCAVNDGGTIENVSIASCSLSVMLYAPCGIKVGAFGGELKNGASVKSCEIAEFSYFTQPGFSVEYDWGSSSKSYIEKDAANNYYIGGLAGYMASGTSLLNSKISKFNINNDGWQKHNDKNFYAGGIVGYAESATITGCQNLGGTMNLTRVYLTEEMGIAGIAGGVKNLTLQDCLSKSRIVVEHMSGGGANARSDYPSFAGLVGIASGANIRGCRYECDDTFVLKSGVEHTVGTTYDVYFGGLVGLCRDSVNVQNSYSYIPKGVDSSNTTIERYYFGLFVGNAYQVTNFDNCYSIIKGRSATLNKNGLTTQKGMYTGDIGQKIGTVKATNCFKATVNFETNTSGNYGYNFSSGLTEFVKNADYATKVNALLGSIWNSSTDKIQSSIKFNYGYNKNLQKDWLQGETAPFAISRYVGGSYTGGYSEYRNILIDCTNVAGNLTTNGDGGSLGNCFVYPNTSGIKYLYGTAVNDNFDGTKYSLTLPTVYLNGSKKVKYYSTQKDGKDTNGNPSIYARPGDEVVAQAGQGDVVLYPIFDSEFYIYSPTRLTVNSKAVPSKVGNTTIFAGVNTNMDITCEVSEKVLTDAEIDGIYIYRYTIKFSEQNNIVELSNSTLQSIFGLYTDGIDENIAKNLYWFVNNKSLNGIINNGSINSINYVDGICGKYNLYDYTGTKEAT
ncbi:MAG: hypothetical protein ACI4TI_02420, partial [Christensenellales bacterium]